MANSIYTERELRVMEAFDRRENVDVKQFKNCGHGKSYSEPCIECDILWHEECLSTYQERVAHHQRKLDELRSAQEGSTT